MAKKEYYSIDNLLLTDAEYMIMLGQRANGKSYQAKYTALKDAYNNGKKFVYLRRWKDDIKAAVEAIFNVKVKKVNTVKQDGKVKRFRGYEGVRSDYKKAVITLAEGQSLDLLKN